MELIWLILGFIGAFISFSALTLIVFQGGVPIPVVVIISIFMTALSYWLISEIIDMPNIWQYFWL